MKSFSLLWTLLFLGSVSSEARQIPSCQALSQREPQAVSWTLGMASGLNLHLGGTVPLAGKSGNDFLDAVTLWCEENDKIPSLAANVIEAYLELRDRAPEKVLASYEEATSKTPVEVPFFASQDHSAGKYLCQDLGKKDAQSWLWGLMEGCAVSSPVSGNVFLFSKIDAETLLERLQRECAGGKEKTLFQSFLSTYRPLVQDFLDKQDPDRAKLSSTLEKRIAKLKTQSKEPQDQPAVQESSPANLANDLYRFSPKIRRFAFDELGRRINNLKSLFDAGYEEHGNTLFYYYSLLRERPPKARLGYGERLRLKLVRLFFPDFELLLTDLSESILKADKVAGSLKEVKALWRGFSEIEKEYRKEMARTKEESEEIRIAYLAKLFSEKLKGLRPYWSSQQESQLEEPGRPTGIEAFTAIAGTNATIRAFPKVFIMEYSKPEIGGGPNLQLKFARKFTPSEKFILKKIESGLDTFEINTHLEAIYCVEEPSKNCYVRLQGRDELEVREMIEEEFSRAITMTPKWYWMLFRLFPIPEAIDADIHDF
jgi:hypothetical protein